MIGLWIGLAWVIFGVLAGLIRDFRDGHPRTQPAISPQYNRGWVASAELEIYKHEWFNSTVHSLEECDMRPGREGWLRRETAEYNVRPKVQVVFNPLTTDAILISPLGTVEL